MDALLLQLREVPEPGSPPLPASPPIGYQMYSPPPAIPPLSRVVGCEAGEPLSWNKMSGSASGSAGKKRKKTETKPQSQLTKCLNEKKRREQENIYIEELAELISASFTDMSSLSVKPDKCAILQETVAQIRSIKDQDVQQGEVSSSRPNIPHEVFGPLLLAALEGFLFVVNTEGKIEYCTENIAQFIRYRREEVLGQSVYNFIHHGDHSRFSAWLLPNIHLDSAEFWINKGQQGAGQVQQQAGGQQQQVAAAQQALEEDTQSRPRTFNCRFLIKPPVDSSVEEKQQRPSKYETMQISSTQLPQNNPSERDEDGGESGPCLMCVARRIPNHEKTPAVSGNPLEQFTMKLNTHGRIIGIDSSGLSPPYSQYLTKELVHRDLEELVGGGDISKVSSHLKEALNTGQSSTPVYKLQVSHDKTISVQTKLKLFKGNRIEPDFIMATHSIVSETEGGGVGSPGGSSSVVSVGGSGGSAGAGAGGGRQDLGSLNGGCSTSRDMSNTITLNNSNNSSTFHSVTLNSTDLDFNFDMFPTSTWELGGGGSSSEERGWGGGGGGGGPGSSSERDPESRGASLTPVQSPLYSSGPPQPSPASVAPPSFPPPQYPFSPLQEGGMSEEPHEEDSGRLRNLLMTKRPSTESSDDGGGGGRSTPGSAPGGGGGSTPGGRNKHRILKCLLNQEDEESSHSHPQQQDSKPPNNNMLLRLLNTASDDDTVEAKAGLKSQHELLQQLLKEEETSSQESKQTGMSGGMGYNTGGGGEESRGGRKRPSSEESGGEEQPSGAKRPFDSLIDSIPAPPSGGCGGTPPHGSQAGKSKLWEQNKMLASLLAKRPTTPASIPPIPASVLSATPQDKFQRLVQKHPQSGWSGGSVQAGSPGQPNRSGRSPGYSSQAGNTWDSDDPALSNILDQVIELVPDVTTDSPALMNMLNSLENEATQQQSASQQQQQQQFQQELQEKMAINAIQKSLMLCESAVKGPVYSSQMSQGSPQQQFPPPPIYQPRQKFQMQQPQQIRQQFSLPNQQQLYIAQRHKLQQQQQQQQQMQKQRLLHMQQQQIVVPSQAAAAVTSGPDPALHNIDSLINNTVAPNVSLQRSNSVPDSQSSPVGSYPGLGSVPSPGQRRPFSPVNGGMSSFPSSGGGPPVSVGSGGPQSRLSPSTLQGYQPQLSPRLNSQGQQNYGGGGGTSWSQQNSRLSLQQQDGSVLNQQLSSSGGRGYVTTAGSGGGGGRGGGLPPVRSLSNPQSGAGARYSPSQQGGDQAGQVVSATGGQAYQFRLAGAGGGGQTVQRGGAGVPGSPAPQQLPGRGVGGWSSPPLCHHPQHGPPPPHQQAYPPPEQGYCYPQQQQQPTGHPDPGPPYPSRMLHHPHGGNNGMTEYVRQELRAKVGARTGGRPQVPGALPLPSPVDLEALTYDIQSAGVGDSSKMWGAMSDMAAGSPQSNQQLTARSTMEEVSRSNDQKSSLLQKLLSE